mmetsp:Transcript_5182/g.11727  ORF Transcript_5182/g.11727 Transcript_5182/m.11727 type:complete len:269 (+) Transcript_5182:198-1004(+)
MLTRLLTRRILPSSSHLPSSILIIHQIPLLQNLKPSILQRRQTMMRRCNIRQPIPLLNLLLNRNMFLIFPIVLIRQTPLVACKNSTGLENAVNLRVASNTIRSMTRRLDGIRSIKARLLERLLHEIALHRPTAHVGESGMRILRIPKMSIGTTQLVAPVDLVLIQCQSRDVGASELANVAHWTANAASDVQHLDTRHGRRASLPRFLIPILFAIVHLPIHAIPNLAQRTTQIQLTRQVKFMPPRRLLERFVRVAIRKVEGGAPPPFVK